MDVKFAAEADNCVIDRKGRLAARKGTIAVSTNGASVLGSSAGIEFMHEFEAENGTLTTVSAGNNLVFTGTTTLVDATPVAATVTANNWAAATLSNKFYLFQAGHAPLVMPAAGSFDLVSNDGAYTGTVPEGDVVLAAFGRLFVANTAAEKSTIYWSDLLNGVAWSGGSSGSINLRKYWPQGYDTIVALIEHNNFLVVFGKKSILVYSGAIMVLFLFIIMLLDLKESSGRPKSLVGIAGGISLVVAFVLQLIGVLSHSPNEQAPALNSQSLAQAAARFPDGSAIASALKEGSLPDVHLIGHTLFTHYNFPFQILGILLLVATVGVVVLSKKQAE